MGLIDRLKRSWNVFLNRDPTDPHYRSGGTVYYSGHRPDRVRFSGGNERTIVTSVFNKIAMDAAAIEIKHVKLDENGRYKETVDSPLNNCLNTEANIDQTGRAFRQDVYMSLLDEGCISVVPVDTDIDPTNTSSFDILSMRTGKITEWFPEDVRVYLYNERTGKKEHVVVGKRSTAIIESPLFSVVNERSSTMQRLVRKLNLLDAIDEQIGSGKLDLIIQLPYVVKTDLKKQQAEQRRKDIIDQLSTSDYGIAYIDGTERVTQLNRPVENNLMKQIEYLTSMLFSQLGITQAIMDGTADETTMLNYYTRTIEPLVSAVVDEMKRKFLSKTARTQMHSICFFRNPFGLVPVDKLAEMADKFTRNEIMTSNEIRQIIGLRPSTDPKADELRNSNLNHPDEQVGQPANKPEEIIEEGESQNG